MSSDPPRSPPWLVGAAVVCTTLALAVPLGRQSSGSGLGAGTAGAPGARAPLRAYGARAATADPTFLRTPTGAAFTLSGVADELVFVTAGEFVEFADGSAQLIGVIISATEPNRRFRIELDFTDETGPDFADYPPPGVPMLELEPHAYADAGGPVVPGEWHAFRSVRGTLSGMGECAGAVYEITNTSPMQKGFGANGRNVGLGLAGSFHASLVHEAEGVWFPEWVEGALHLDLEGVSTHALRAAGARALWLPGFGDDLVLVSGGTLTELSDGTARLRGVLASTTAPEIGWSLALELEERTGPREDGHPPAGSPKLELPLARYVPGGGAIDPDHWRYYGMVSGVLAGVGALRGAILEVEGWGPAFQIGFGASGASDAPGASTWLTGRLLQQPLGGARLPWFLNQGDVSVELLEGSEPAGGERSFCARRAAFDAAYGLAHGGYLTDGYALWLPGVARDLVFVAGGRLDERRDGTARLSGVVASASDPRKRLVVDLTFAGRVEPGGRRDPFDELPKQDLAPEAYAEHGGPIDPAGWRTYATTRGSLVGLGDLAGAVITVERLGPGFQVGFGAGGKNLRFGGSGWIAFHATSQPRAGMLLPTELTQGDVSLDLTSACTQCAAGAEPEFELSRGPIAVSIEGLGHFAFDPTGTFEEHGDGTARLSGVLRSLADVARGFDIELTFEGRVSPGLPGHPPAGSPVRGFSDAMFVEGDGPLEAGLWHYYARWRGTLAGFGALGGAELSVAGVGSDFQVGLGANGRNLGYGASGAFVLEALRQPALGPPLPEGAGGVLRVDLWTGCP